MEDENKKFYRYEKRVYTTTISDISPSLNSYRIEVIEQEFNLFKETPKGYWIGYGGSFSGKLRGNAIWVSKTSKKRFAYPTKEEALNSFMIRINRRMNYLQEDLRICGEALSKAAKLLK